MINQNPKGDSMLVLTIVLELEAPGPTVDKEWLLDWVKKINAEKEPYKLLRGEAYTRFLTLKNTPRFQSTAI